MNYEILISVSLGDNFPLTDEFLARECQGYAILEAKFNDEILQSDPIELDSSNPELSTELGFRVNKKDFHQFRVERKAIKLQCYVEYSNQPGERHFIGYVVLHLRDAQEYADLPRYKWFILLNPKYKGSSTKRPQLYMAFMVNKLNEEGDEDSSKTTNQLEQLEAQFSRRSTKPSPMMTSSYVFNDFDTSLKVLYQDRHFFVWDENRINQSDCRQSFVISVTIERPAHLVHLFRDEEAAGQVEQVYFQFTMFGRVIKTNSFYDLTAARDFKRHKFSFPVKTFGKEMLASYFESYPTIEVVLVDNKERRLGFVSLNVLKLFQGTNNHIEADFMVSV